MSRVIVSAALLLSAVTLSGCFSDRRPAQGPSDIEYTDQDDYAHTQTTGPGSETSSGYYGVGNEEESSHAPAHPSASGGHRPY